MSAWVNNSCRRAFTLVETALSLAVISVLLAGMGSLIVLSAQSVPGRANAADSTSIGGRLLEELSAELQSAVSIRMASGVAVEFTVPDRNGDGKPEAIRYQWSGKAGDPMERIFNEVSSPIAPSVSSFGLAYLTQTIKEIAPDSVTQMPESLVSTYTGGLLYTERKQAGTQSFIGQNIRPAFGAGTQTWTITRAQVWTRSEGVATGTSRVQIRSVGPDGKPTASILADAVLNESAVGSGWGLNQVTFQNAPALLPNEEVSIVVVCETNCPSASVGYVGLSLAGALPIVTSDNGSSWTLNSLGVIPHHVWATSTVTAPTSQTRKRLHEVEVRLQLGNGMELRTTVVLANTPEVS